MAIYINIDDMAGALVALVDSINNQIVIITCDDNSIRGAHVVNVNNFQSKWELCR